MTKLTRNQFINQLRQRQIDLSAVARDQSLPDAIKQAVRRADIDGDGKISTRAEASKLFTELDRFDRDGSYHSLLQTGAIARLLGLTEVVPTITRDEVQRQLEGKQVGVLNLLNTDMPRSTERHLAGADLDGNGVIRGDREVDALFSRMDDYDSNGSRHSMKRTPMVDTVLDQAEPARAGSAAPTAAPASVPTSGGRVVGHARGTGYYPANNQMEGGFVDKQDTPLRTLQDFLDGRANYVSIALDKNLYRSGAISYGDRFRIPELEAKYGRPIEFRAVDTGGRFTNRGFGRVDICTRSRAHSEDPTINGSLTLMKIDD